MRAEIAPQVATKADLDALGASLRGEIALVRRDLDAQGVRSDAMGVRLEQKIETHAQHIEGMIWKAAFAILGGGLAVGGLLIGLIK